MAGKYTPLENYLRNVPVGSAGLHPSYAILESMDVLAQLPEITKRIVKTSNPEKIILFGSYARGETGHDSDLDLLVIVPGVKRLRAESVRVRRALRGLLIPIDVILATPEQIKRLGGIAGLIYHTALSEGKVVYERPN